MASALLLSRNEPCWGEPKVYMRKNPSPSPKLCTYPNPNPSRNFNQAPNDYHVPRPLESDESTASAAAFGDFAKRRDSVGFVTFNISSYSKKDMRDLKRRLIFELDQVRSVKSRIESMDFCPAVGSDGGEFPSSVRSNGSAWKTNQIRQSVAINNLHHWMMNRCGQILTKLMRSKGATWFNSPVDVAGMGLHDYHQIIKNPMDLGTVKSNLGKGFYLKPLEFAADVRLTFRNALVYNPEGHHVHRLADQLLRQFEGAFGPAYNKYEKQTSVQTQPDQTVQPTMPPVKQPKPKSNDANKRAMNMKEKEKLGMALQNLPEDKMNEVLDIIRERNVEMPRDGDEVEIDFDLMDNETIWELDRFVNNWYKMASKVKHPVAGKGLPQLGNDAREANDAGKEEAAAAAEEDEVDIGDEMPVVNYPSVEIEREESSSSSGGDSSSSSSSDSDSGSSSGGDSDDGDGDAKVQQQPANNSM